MMPLRTHHLRDAREYIDKSRRFWLRNNQVNALEEYILQLAKHLDNVLDEVSDKKLNSLIEAVKKS